MGPRHWNQFGDDLRGVDAVAAIGNAGTAQASDGVVETTAASLDFALPDAPEWCLTVIFRPPTWTDSQEL